MVRLGCHICRRILGSIKTNTLQLYVKAPFLLYLDLLLKQLPSHNLHIGSISLSLFLTTLILLSLAVTRDLESKLVIRKVKLAVS